MSDQLNPIIVVIVWFFITQDKWKDSIEKKSDLLLEKVTSMEKKVVNQRREGEVNSISTPAPSKKRVCKNIIL